jgi:PAS domain S-box-containing protein
MKMKQTRTSIARTTELDALRRRVAELEARERERAESEARFRAIFDSSHDAIMLLNQQGFFDCNARTLEMFGFASKEAFTAVHPADISPPAQPDGQDSWSAAGARMEAAHQKGFHRFHWIHRRANGEDFPADVLLTAFELGGEQVLQATVRDITKQKRAEAALRESEERFRRLFEDSADAILLIEQNRFIDCNLAALEMLRMHAKDELYNTHPSQLSPERQPDGRLSTEKADEMIARAYQEGSHRFEWMHRRADGEVFPVEVLLTPLKIGDRQLLHTVWRDIADRKRAEAAIIESERRLSDIIEFLPDATLVIDAEGKVVAWNRAIEEMTGTPASEMLGRGEHEYAIPFYGERRPILIDLVSLEDEEFAAKYAHLQRRGVVLAGETYVPMGGNPHYLFATASALYDSAGRQVGAIEVIHDITDRKRVEEELEEAKMAAEAANEAKSAFLAMMSHEIRTPMNAIIGMSGLLMNTSLDAEQREFAETIRDSSDALLTIINDILDFSKIEAGRMELEEQPFRLRDCVESAMDLVKIKAMEKGLELAYEIDLEVPSTIVGDVTRLRQILVNLLNNAVKFTEQGEVVATVTAGRLNVATFEGSNVQTLHFAVRDTGIGIPADRMDRLFRSFSQVDASTTRKYGGTGLGLAISKRLSQLMGGDIWVESEGIPGQGCTFHFTIRAEAAPEIQARAILREEQPELRDKRLLIVDDNATNRRILVLQTRAWGMLARDTESPGEALDWLRRGDPFDLAILDMQMPEMTGLELAAEIRALEAERGALALPLVFFSSVGGREIVGDTDYFAAYLTKPLKPSVLYESLMEIFAQQSASEIEKSGLSPALDQSLAAQHPLRILLAEDNVVNQKVALRLLSQMGYQADVAANGLEVIEAIARQPYDVVLMDVQMPELDGLEATRRICARWPRNQRPRIVAMTASAMQGDREMCIEAGMDDYLSKPIRVEELAAALSRSQSISAEDEPAELATLPEEVIDRSALEQLVESFGGDRAFLNELLDAFLDDAPEQIAAMQTALSVGDSDTLRRAAHSLKSPSASFGATALAESCRQLEELATAGNLSEASPQLDRVTACFDDACVALKMIVRSYEGRSPK